MLQFYKCETIERVDKANVYFHRPVEKLIELEIIEANHFIVTVSFTLFIQDLWYTTLGHCFHLQH
jgi:hypothetical protein